MSNNEIHFRTDNITFKVPGFTIPWLHDYACRRLMTVSELIRHALAYYIDQFPQSAVSDHSLAAALEDVQFRQCTPRRYTPPVAAQAAAKDEVAQAALDADLADFEERANAILAGLGMSDSRSSSASAAPLDTMETIVSDRA